MVVHAAVSSTEVFEVESAVRAVLGDRETRRSRSEEEFRERAGQVVRTWRPGCTDGFVQIVTAKAWLSHTGDTVRLELSPAALALVAERIGTLSAEPGAELLRAEIAAAAERLGW